MPRVAKTKLAKKLNKTAKKLPKKRKSPLWEGPMSAGSQGGITQSLLGAFLVGRERFRVKTIEGLQTTPTFNHRMEYGNMWHLCEENFADGKDWQTALRSYCQEAASEYRFQQIQVEHWYHVCRTQFPIYISFWEGQKDVRNRTPLLQEESFRVPYKLPDGRVVYLRGKWDSVDLIGPKKNPKVYLQENKTKGDIKERAIRTQLKFDMQSMFYLLALNKCFEYAEHGTELDTEDMLSDDHQWGNLICPVESRPVGVRYNVVRRPLSGGKGSIRQHQPTKKNPAGETKAEFYNRVGEVIKNDPSHFFMRWKVDVTQQDLERFEHRFLIPILAQLCDWWQWVSNDNDVWGMNGDTGCYVHWQHPFGVYNVLNEGGSSELDEYLDNGSKLGLTRATTLFNELE